MAFITTLSNNYDKLRNKDMVNILWKEILNEERSEQYLDELIEYSFHYPVDSDAYLQNLHEKFDALDKSELRTIDGHLKAYMVTFLYYCTNRYNRRVPIKTTVLASALYLKLITIPDVGKIFFEKNLYKAQLFVFINAANEESVEESTKVYLLKLYKEYCLQEKLEVPLLKGTANTIAGVLMIESKDIVNDMRHISPLARHCCNCLKELIHHEEGGHRLVGIIECLFRCLKTKVLGFVPNRPAALSTVILFIRDELQNELEEDKFQYLLEAFCNIWGHDDFTYYDEAIVVMNLLRVPYYKELVRKMVLYSQSKNHRHYLINVMNLILAIVKNLPTFPLDKVEVLYSCALRNVVFHFIDKDKKIANRAIEVVTSMCVLKDNPMLTIIFNQIQASGKFINLSVEALFLSFNEIVDAKWGLSSRNQNLLIIMAKFLAHSRNVNVDLVHKTVQAICKDCTPFSLKPSLQILHELFCVMALKEEDETAQEILKIIYKNAMHQDATSVEFLNHIFKSLLYPSVINNITYDPKYYYKLFLTSDFEYEALFTKCQKKIRAEHIHGVVESLNYDEPGGAILLCCLLKFYKYEETTELANFFIDNFSHIATRETMGPLSIAFLMILENKTITDQDIPQLDVLQSSITEALFEQSFQIPSIKPAYDLFQKIRRLLRISNEDQLLNQLLNVTSERVLRRLIRGGNGDNSVFMYLNEVCLLVRKLPPENLVQLLELFIKDPNDSNVISRHCPDAYLQVVTLFTTLAMMDKRKVPLAIKHLREILKDEQQIVKVLGFKLYFSLCQEVTHEYEEIIAFSLKEISIADPCLVKLCVITLEELIHNDFIKLCSENFFRFIYPLGCDDLTIFMKELLVKRFAVSNQNDIAKFYVQSIIYMHMYSKFPNYPISSQFDSDLVSIKLKMNNSKEIPGFLFGCLPIRKKMNVLCEIAEIFNDIIRGNCKIDSNFYGLFRDLVVTFKFVITTNLDTPTEKHYYSDMCKQIEKQIVDYDPSYRKERFYGEFENEIKKCTLILLQLLFLENQQLADNIQIPLFDAVIHWIDFIKPEIVHYVHVERGKDYKQYFGKLVQYYKRNKIKFVTPDR